MQNLFTDVSFIVIGASVLGLLAHFIKQPAILAYVAVGIILGPFGFELIKEPEFIHTLSTFGIALLLFMVGLELDLRKLGEIGKVSLFLGVGQVLFTAAIGFFLATLFGNGLIPSAYIAVALTFSSTIIIVKLLSEKKAVDSLYGRIAIGMLLVQDVMAIIALIILSGFNNGQGPSLVNFIFIAGKGLALLAVVMLAYRFLVEKLFRWLAGSGELLLLSGIAWCFALAILSVWLGFSVEIGAFIAGLSLASLPYHLEMVGRVRPLRDFFITIFFVGLGSQLVFSAASSLWLPIIALSLFVLIGNPIIVMVIMGLMGYRKRTAFLVGLTVAQISEFSLILMSLGEKLGHLSIEQVSLVTIIGVITITLSSYFITYDEKLYRFLKPILRIFEKNKTNEPVDLSTGPLTNHTVVFGYHRLGEKIVATLKKLNQEILVIDFDPEVIKKTAPEKVSFIYGDMADLDILEKARIDQAKMIISTVPDVNDNLLLIKDMKKQQATAPVYLTANNWPDTKTLYEAGADYVIFPHHLSGEHFSLMLQNQLVNKNRFLVDKTKHLKELEIHYSARQRN
ncbi:cation:proton antiporter [Patescibacteria group bacterium]|nr:cation:proton antiporter [Patescibacteria group bacterium]